jgi:hypothetical protein
MISPPVLWATATAKVVLPDAVGPVTTNKSYMEFNTGVTFLIIYDDKAIYHKFT